ALCNFKTLNVEGKSILPLLENPNLKWDEAAFSVYPKGKSRIGLTCTDGILRYTEWWDTEAQTLIENELYLTRSNYTEATSNLVKDIRYEKDVKRMMALLEKQYPKEKRINYPQYDK
ncbi:MAG: hypothetical protein NWQ38_05165, partial [Cellulophaga sp.]|nr:hypothetical protein [Cellulophaga sp.]